MVTKKNKKSKIKFKKSPLAPRRFKSAYMFFSTDKHKEIREENETKGVEEKTTNIAKLVSQAWKSLSTTDRSKWEDLARKDKLRYELEKSTYTGPWKIPAKEFSKKDPGAPKRPMSAFLAFSHKNRASVKASMKDENNDTGPTTLTNAELSRVLARMWKDASDEEKKEYIDTEYKLRQKYLKEIAVWREEKENEFQDQRKQREEVALQTVAARGDNPMVPGPNEPQYHQHAQQYQEGGSQPHYHSQQQQYEKHLQGTKNHAEYYGAQYAYNSLAGAAAADRAYYMHAAAAAQAHQQVANTGSDSQAQQPPNTVTPPPPTEYYASEAAAAYPPAYAYGGYGGHPAYYSEEAHYYQQAAAANGEHYPYSLPPTYAAAPHEDHAQQQQVPPQQPPSHHAPSAPEGHYNQWSSV